MTLPCLTLSDEIVPSIYSLGIKQRFDDAQLVLGCGDLPFYYLEFVVTMLGVPCLYIRGNHDRPELTAGGEVINEARGCACLENRSLQQDHLLFAGLGGSRRYNQRGGDQYTEREMLLRVWRLTPRLLYNRYRYGRYLDVLLTHAPPHGIHDGSDHAHQGFRVFLRFMERFAPRYLIHGHMHRCYNPRASTETRYHTTYVLNTAGYRRINLAIPSAAVADQHYQVRRAP